jgi:methyl-accepting chemotaxis protein
MGKMRKTLTWQLGRIIIGIIFISLLITSIATYITAYDKIYEAAGIEAYGCANITTGLLDPNDIEKIKTGDSQIAEKVSETINWTIGHKDIFETQYIIDVNGELLALDDNLREAGYEVGDSFYIDKEAISMLVEGKHSTYSEIYEFGGIKRLSGYAPIFKDHDPSKEIIAISVIDFDASIVTERTWDVISGGLLIGIIPMIIASAITIILLRRKTKPISSLIKHAKQVAAGNLAVKKLEIHSKDEVGELAETLDVMTTNLQDIISILKKSSHQLSSNAKTSSASLQEMNLALHQVSTSMEFVAAETAHGTEQGANAVESLQKLVAFVQSTKEKAISSVRNSTNTLQTAQHGKEKVIEITSKMDGIKAATLETEKAINHLNNYTSEIKRITETINGIAGQTNLLALNASIEAARAGEHGKGFAVVADEVRKLAEQSNREVASVEELVLKITDSIQKTVKSIHESRYSVEQGENAVHETGTALGDILKEVTKTVHDINEIASITTEETTISKETNDKIQQLVKAVENVAAHTMEVSAATEQSTASIEEIANRSNDTVEMATDLNKIVEKFDV